MKYEDLDERQRQVLDAVVGTNDSIMVLGGAGTGKTTTALWASRKYLESPATDSASRVLFLTFSRSAVGQIVGRSPGVISGFEDRIEVSTFHALAFRLISAFGRYAGHGSNPPAIQGEARARLLGHNQNQYRYDDLMPEATKVLQSSRVIRELVGRRWGLIICDEVQDTNDEQWRFIQDLVGGKLLLLGNDNQMIYTFIRGVSQERFDTIRNSVDRVIRLELRSHRDPSGLIPSLAEAVRTRRFTDSAVLSALQTGRLEIHFDVDEDDLPNLLANTIAIQRGQGARDVGVFAHSNSSVTKISAQLTSVGVRHVIVGIPEAHAEALASMATQCAYAAERVGVEVVRESFGVYLTATSRGSQVPQLARALVGASPLPCWIEGKLEEIEKELRQAGSGSIRDVADVATGAWDLMGIPSGTGPWNRAARHFRRLISALGSRDVCTESISELIEIVQERRMQALVESDFTEGGRVRLMNFHQTKGREADVVIHVFKDDDFFGYESEPFPKTSRLLNVAVSRARESVVMILPRNPAAVVQPFEALRVPELADCDEDWGISGRPPV